MYKMSEVDSIAKLCNLPIDSKKQNKSALQLIEESGYNAETKWLSVTKIIVYLRDKPELIEAWLLWSLDKRTSSGWCFREEPDGFTVAFYPDGLSRRFADQVEACAEFILQEVNSIAAKS